MAGRARKVALVVNASDGELDAIIIALPFQEADVLTMTLYDEPFCVVMPASHPWTAKTSIDPALLNDKSLLLLGEGHCFRDQVLESCPRLSAPDALEHSLEGSSLETIRYMVASGAGGSSRAALRSSGRVASTPRARSWEARVRSPRVPDGKVHSGREENACTSACVRLAWRLVDSACIRGPTL